MLRLGSVAAGPNQALAGPTENLAGPKRFSRSSAIRTSRMRHLIVCRHQGSGSLRGQEFPVRGLLGIGTAERNAPIAAV